jgi:phosphonate transport system substrate-binding protein
MINERLRYIQRLGRKQSKLRWRGLLFVLVLLMPMSALAEEARIRIGLTAVFLDNKTSFLRDWERYLETKLDAPVEFVQRQSYREITELLIKGQIDVAWICGYPYVMNSDKMRLLAAPLYRGKPLYRSYLVVPASDVSTSSIEGLQNRIFAYSDPDSNSGYLAPQVELIKSGFDPKYFFSRVFYTWSHRDVVLAVAEGLAQGGAVDGYVWDTLAQSHPELTERTRVVSKSEVFGFPPFVASLSLPQSQFIKIQHTLIDMNKDPAGARLLSSLNIDGFTVVDATLYEGIRNEVRVYTDRP